MSNRDFSTIAVGDTVIFKYDYGRKRSLHKVVKVTKTQITIEGNRVFSKRNGRQLGRGNSYDSPDISIPTGDDIASVTAEREHWNAMGKFTAVVQEIQAMSMDEDISTEKIKAATVLLSEVARVLAEGESEVQPEPPPSSDGNDGRDPTCVAAWPDCVDGEYDPLCCRFPKSCSCGPR
jgi:hypothetical protein